jgi:hypothetical protein
LEEDEESILLDLLVALALDVADRIPPDQLAALAVDVAGRIRPDRSAALALDVAGRIRPDLLAVLESDVATNPGCYGNEADGTHTVIYIKKKIGSG